MDFNDTFSITAKIVAIRSLLSLAVVRGWSLTQLDVANAFLQMDLDEQIFMQLPLGINSVVQTRFSSYASPYMVLNMPQGNGITNLLG